MSYRPRSRSAAVTGTGAVSTPSAELRTLTRKTSRGKVIVGGESSLDEPSAPARALPQPSVASPTDALLSPISRAIKKRKRTKAPSAAALPTVLGSSSVVRAHVLTRHGVAFSIEVADIDEKAVRHADPSTMTLLIARAKAAAIRPRLAAPCILITADQIVLAPDGRVCEKPVDAAEAAAFLRAYAGATARTVSAVVVTNTRTGAVAEGVEVATVHFSAGLGAPGAVDAALAPRPPIDPLSLPRAGAGGRGAGGGGRRGSAAAAGAAAAAAAAAGAHADGGHAVDVLRSAGALVIEHPELARHITLIEGDVDSIQGLPWSLTSSLIASVTAAAAAAPGGATAGAVATSAAAAGAAGGGGGGRIVRRTRASIGEAAAAPALGGAAAGGGAARPRAATSGVARRDAAADDALALPALLQSQHLRGLSGASMASAASGRSAFA